jgi:non-ribosomal peptide synthase protein (TIGR01720 family)
VSFKAWSEKLAAYAENDAVTAELDGWLDRVNGWIAPLPVDRTCDAADNTEESAAQVGAALSAEETEALLTEAGAAYNTEISELLLCALARTMERWTGEPALYAHLEGHGREPLDEEEVDVSRTVGWFTTFYPVRLDLPWGATPGEAIVAAKEQLRAIPQRGLGYGLLRYLGGDDARAALAAAPEPELTFNYLGQFDQVLGRGDGPAPLGPAREMPGRDRAASNRRTHLLDVTAAIAGRRLSVSWTFSRAAHHEATAQQLAEWYIEALRELIAHCRSPEAGAYTPSDFPLAELDQKQLDKVLKKVKTK